MSKVKYSNVSRIISIILIATFIAFDISWAYPPGSNTQSSTLATPSLLQQQPIDTGFQQSMLSQASLLGSACTIAKYLLEERLPVEYLEQVISEELGKAVEGIGLSGVTVKDGVVSIPCEINGTKQIIQIALKDSASAKGLSGYIQIIADKYVVKVLPGDSSSSVTKSFPAGEGDAGAIADAPRSRYRYIGVSMGGNKLAVALVDGNGKIIGEPAELRWDDDARFNNRQVSDASKASEVMEALTKMISDIIEKNGADKKLIRVVSASLAGPVDKSNGVFGSDFKTPNLPFDKYPFRNELVSRLAAKGMTVSVDMCNDAEAARKGERFSPRGQLRGVAGGIVIIGGGINISVDDSAIMEAGHNLFQAIDESGDIHYIWAGDRTQGRHPIERGNTPEEIQRKSGDMGKEYLSMSDREFSEKYTDFPFIDWEKGLRDFEDRLSGPNIRARLKAMIDIAKKTQPGNIGDYLAIERRAGHEKRKNEYERVLTPEALRGNRLAMDWIRNIADEIGLALAAFAASYRDRDFVNHLVLVSGICENLGKDVYENAADRLRYEDIFIKHIRQSANRELIGRFGLSPQKAQDITYGIVRSRMTYERELVFHYPTNEEIVAALSRSVTKSFPAGIRRQKDLLKQAKESYRYIGVSMDGDRLLVSLNDGNNNIIGKTDEFRWTDDPKFKGRQFSDVRKSEELVRKAEEVMDVLANMIANIVERNNVDKSRIRKIAASLAGPVDNEKGVFGSEFRAPYLPFDKYKFRASLAEKLKTRHIIADIEMCNDSEAARNGEIFSPRGGLRKAVSGGAVSGGVVFIGRGVNIAVGDDRIKEAGHNIIQVAKDRKGNIHYRWVGDKTKGRHPIERGNTPEEIGRKSGDIGIEYLNLGEKRFKEKYPKYPFIEWKKKGMRDFEETSSGLAIRERVRKAIERAKSARSKPADIEEYLAIERTGKQDNKGRLEYALTPEANRGNAAAISLIKEVADEIGLALAAFIAAHKNEDFVNNLVLVSGVSENMGKDVYEQGKSGEADIFIDTVRNSAKMELMGYFKLSEDKASRAANGITRSRMEYDRQLVSYQPDDREILAAAKRASGRSTTNLTSSYFVKDAKRQKIVEMAHYTYNRVSGKFNAAHARKDGESINRGSLLNACLQHVFSGISVPEGFPHEINIKVVSGLGSLSNVDIADELQNSVILIDETLLASTSLDAKWLLLLEIENKILRLSLELLKNRAPPPAEDAALMVTYLARFNAFEKRKRDETLAFLERNSPRIDRDNFRSLLKDSQSLRLEEAIDKIVEHLLKQNSLSIDKRWLRSGPSAWQKAIIHLFYSNIMTNLLMQDIFITSDDLTIAPPQSSPAFWSFTDWIKIFERASMNLTNSPEAQKVEIEFNYAVRSSKKISFNIPKQLTGRERVLMAKFLAVFIIDHLTTEGSSEVTVTTDSKDLRKAIEEVINKRYSGMMEYFMQYNDGKLEIMYKDENRTVPFYRKNLVIGLDLGGSSELKAVVIENGGVIYSAKYALPKKAESITSTAEYTGILADKVRTVIAEAGVKNDDIYSIGISWAGAINDKGEIAATSKIVEGVESNEGDKTPDGKIVNGLKKVKALGRELTNELKMPVYIVNDGDAIAFGLATYAEMKDTLCLGFGTSLAMGYIDENGDLATGLGEGSKIIVDMTDNAGEHTGRKVRGVVQQYTSEKGVIRVAEGFPEFEAMLKSYDASMKAEQIGQQVVLYKASGEKVLEKVAEYIALAIHEFHRYYRMERVILSGGVMNSESGKVILAKVKELISSRYPVIDPDKIKTSAEIERAVEDLSRSLNRTLNGPGKGKDQVVSYPRFANAIGAAQYANQMQFKQNTGSASVTKNFPAGPEPEANNKRTGIVESANKLLRALAGNTDAASPARTAAIDKTRPTAEIKYAIENTVAAIESAPADRISPAARATAEDLRKRIDQLEAGGIVASIIRLARKAKREGQKLIIGLETDWVPGYNERDNLQHQAMNPLVKEIESIPNALRSMGLDNVVLVHKSSKDLASSVIKEADGSNTKLSNVVILASRGTVESPDFAPLRSTDTEERAFIAAINPAELEAFLRDNNEPLKHLDIKILEMLSIALEMASGKEPPNIPMVVSYNKSLRLVILMPRAEPKDYEELKRNYYARKTALAAA